jgi:pilus assembly protein Flp/PilA
MKKLTGGFRSFVKDEDGATMVEYGIMVALIAAVCIATVALIGSKIEGAFSTVNTNLPAA